MDSAVRLLEAFPFYLMRSQRTVVMTATSQVFVVIAVSKEGLGHESSSGLLTVVWPGGLAILAGRLEETRINAERSPTKMLET